jgi:hypothetical protein
MNQGKTFNLYCDESCHLEHDGKRFMLLAYVKCPYPQVRMHTERIKALKKEHGFKGEIKWSKLSHKMYGFYHALIEYFFATDLSFRALVVRKDQVKKPAYGQDYDTFYYKMYYQLLYHKIDMQHHYNIYLDVKDTLSAAKVNRLKDILRIDYSTVRNLQNIRSHESYLMQLTDVLMGAIGYLNNTDDQAMVAKTRLIERMRIMSGTGLNDSTSKGSEKFNLFFIDLK